MSDLRRQGGEPPRSPYCIANVLSLLSDPVNLSNTARFMIATNYQDDPCHCACCQALIGSTP